MFSLFISNDFIFVIVYSGSTGRLAHPTLSETSHIFIISSGGGKIRTFGPRRAGAEQSAGLNHSPTPPNLCVQWDSNPRPRD